MKLLLKRFWSNGFYYKALLISEKKKLNFKKEGGNSLLYLKNDK